MKHAVVLSLAFLFLCGLAFGQDTEPRYLVAIGAGFNRYESPSYSATGTVGIRIASGLYSVTSLDNSTRVDPITKARTPLATIRTGAQKVIYQSGPVSIAAAADAGLAASNDSVAGSFSTGGTLVYNLPIKAPLSIYGNVRILRSAQATTPGEVQAVWNFGLLWRLN
jgi:hypothetical protein